MELCLAYQYYVYFHHDHLKWLAYNLDHGKQSVSGNCRNYFLVFKHNTCEISSNQYLSSFTKPERYEPSEFNQ